MSTQTVIAGKPPEKSAGPGNRPKTPFWYKNAIIYELHVRSFRDSDGDGTGDFRGLTSKLDYLRDLGVTALWLLPFCPSPLKDDGYDISNYCGVHPMYGTLEDFQDFLQEAHRRGLRVITELVLNHTSDQHPWFQRARRSRPGGKYYDYYVWNDSPEKYKEARVIFKDTETSNWTWDAVANAFYWHRFFSHQPDLNFDNPLVHEEMLKAIDFWFDLGVDGIRLDAVPYLYEREGTSCENLPETHEFLKKLRGHVDRKYGDRMLLAEANQWPDDAVKYFGEGKGDECHMAFHFPLMPRLFMGLRMEDRVPIVDILQQTPAIPETAQWALFLRNHDELTLEMVTDEERDYMYRMYAEVHQARLNLGIRRRLAPLLGNDRRRIELLTALLFSLPGTPVIYYGDEIGMGENIYLGDRNGVRTPMQWSADKNAGFSRANPQSLFLPINLDPENHYEAVNVEVQERNNFSLLWWMRRLIALAKRQQAFGAGAIEFIEPENRKIFAFVRRFENEIILVVANLSRFVQPAELDLSRFAGLIPVELFGRTEFLGITEKPYPLTLGPHGFYWFGLEPRQVAAADGSGVSTDIAALASLTVEKTWEEVFQYQTRWHLERAFQVWLPLQRWFPKGQVIKTVRILEIAWLPLSSEASAEKCLLTFVHVDYAQGEPDTYTVPLCCAFDQEAATIGTNWTPLVLARLNVATLEKQGLIYDAIANQNFSLALVRLIAQQQRIEGNPGQLEGARTTDYDQLFGGGAPEFNPAMVDQSHSSVILGEKAVLKLFRTLDFGTNPELEIGAVLTAQRFPFAPPLAGAVEYRSARREAAAIAMLTAFVPQAKDAWEFTLEALGKFYERVLTLPAEKRSPQLPEASLSELAAAAPTSQAREMIDTYLENARVLGERTAAMHLALAAETENPGFRSEFFTPHGQRGMFQSIRNVARENLLLLSRMLKTLPPEVAAEAQHLLALEPAILKKLRQIYERPIHACRTRIHGDYHLGQILYTGKDFLITNFAGERPLANSERRLNRSPLTDVAAMIRSFHYAAHAALLQFLERGEPAEHQLLNLQRWSQFWARWVSATFYGAYMQAARGAPFLPGEAATLKMLLEVLLLRKALYELGYELKHRPGWATIPIQGILEMAPQTLSTTPGQ